MTDRKLKRWTPLLRGTTNRLTIELDAYEYERMNRQTEGTTITLRDAKGKHWRCERIHRSGSPDSIAEMV